MKQTENYELNLLEIKDTLSPVPLNENAQMIDAALKTLTTATAERLKIASGSYTGNGAMSVTIQTPGLKPRAMLVRMRTPIGYKGQYAYEQPGWVISRYIDRLEVSGGWLLWFGWDIPVTYSYVTEYENGKATDGKNANTAVRFESTFGRLQWSVADANASELPELVNNVSDVTYDWIVLGTEGE